MSQPDMGQVGTAQRAERAPASQMVPVPYSKPPEEKKPMPVEKASLDISKTSAELQKFADKLNTALMADGAIHSFVVRRHLERLIEDEEDRRELREEMDELEERAEHAEEAREEGDGDELAETANDIRIGVEDLGEVVRVVVSLRSAGAPAEIVTAVRRAAHDMRAGEPGTERERFRARGALLAELGEYYSRHLPTLGTREMEGAREALLGAIRSLSRQAGRRAGAPDAAGLSQEIRALLSLVSREVEHRERTAPGMGAAGLARLSEECRQLMRIARHPALSRELGMLREAIEHARGAVQHGESPDAAGIPGILARAELMRRARDSLMAGRERRESLPLQGIVARILSALRSGDEAASEAQALIAERFASTSGAGMRSSLSRLSERIAGGTEQPSAALLSISNQLIPAFERLLAGGRITDGRSAGFIRSIISLLREGPEEAGQLRGAMLALAAAERMAESGAGRAPGPARFLRRCLQMLSGGGSTELAALQMDLWAAYARAAPDERPLMESLSLRLSAASSLDCLARRLSGRRLPEDAAERRRALVSAARGILGEEADDGEIGALIGSFERSGGNAQRIARESASLVRECASFLLRLLH